MTDTAAVALAGTSSRDVIVVDQVCKDYGDTTVLSSVSLTCRRGEFVSLLGPSGCGKSTLLMLLAGLEPWTSGAITVDGDQVVAPRTDLGIIFQDPTLLPWRTALENVLLPIEMMGRPLAAYREAALALLREVGLGGAADKRPHELSGGMRQRVAICRALVHDPEILLLDEPFSALDAITRDQMNLMFSDLLQARGKTVVLVTHSISEAVFLSDRIFVMGGRPGTILETVTVDLPRPRRDEIQADQRFLACHEHLRQRLRSSITAMSEGE